MVALAVAGLACGLKGRLMGLAVWGFVCMGMDICVD
jgi:hypothetical protein